MSAARVTLGMTDDDASYPAEIADHHWNGYAVPRFTREVADKLAADLAKLNESRGYIIVPMWDEARQVFTLTDSTFPDEPQEVAADADGLYAIGACEWTWTIDTDATANDAAAADLANAVREAHPALEGVTLTWDEVGFWVHYLEGGRERTVHVEDMGDIAPSLARFEAEAGL